ncbi:MAG TPA: CoA-binding protein [Saprospiraceae bacterium]|nr:CoA-binding protein [Saprospiraceae bacterium]
MAKVVADAGGTLIGPNCIGIINKNYHGVFTTPIPNLSQDGCDLISSSGSTAVFIMEKAVSVGLRFSSVYTVGNAAQISVEDILEHLDDGFNPQTSSRIIMIYVEDIHDPQKFLKHAQSLIKKGCRIAAIKAGATEAGSRAASSHTGAMASSDMVVRALFRKAGIVYCSSRDELITVASIFKYPPLEGPNIAVITHAGGTAVLLTDALERGGLSVPPIPKDIGDELSSYLDPGSSVMNPIDFLATGTADQLGIIIDYVEHKMDFIQGMVVVFGSPGLFNVKNVYQVLNVKMDVCTKPIFPVLPSVINAHQEIDYFTSTGKINFPDEVGLGIALAQVYQRSKPKTAPMELPGIEKQKIRSIIDTNPKGFLSVDQVSRLLHAIGLPQVIENQANDIAQAKKMAHQIGFPIVMKVVGPIHKTDVGGVAINIQNEAAVTYHFQELMKIKDATGVLIQPMLSGVELFIGAKKEDQYGHLVLFGLGGIFVELFKDVRAVLSPCHKEEIHRQLTKLKGYKLLKGFRGQEGIDIDLFVEYILRVIALVEAAPEIQELDINPLFGRGREILVVDARIRL